MSATMRIPANTDPTKVKCAICGHEAHILQVHLAETHDMSLEEYRTKFPEAPVLSRAAKDFLKAREAELRNAMVEVDIKAAFRINPFKNGMTTFPGFQSPHSTTPQVDDSYTFRHDELKAVLYGIGKNRRVLLTGPTGSGKSSIVEQVAARLNWGFHRINFDGDMAKAEVVGQWILKGDETVYQYGILPQAMRDGAILLVDEWDAAPAAVAMVLQAVMEGKPLALGDTGETIKPHPNFRIIATANTVGLGDDSGLYTGTQVQNYAQLDRYNIVRTVDYPNKADERRVLKAKCNLDASFIENLLSVAGLVRDAFKTEKIMVTMSTRTILNLAELLEDFGNPQEAYENGYLNKMSTEDRKVVEEFIQRIWA